MRSVPDGLADCGTLCTIWRLSLTDETVLGFTDHDEALTIDGLFYEPALSSDGDSISGILTSERVTAEDIAAGRYEGAVLTQSKVNWADTAQSVLLSTGRLGDITTTEHGFAAEWTGQAAILERATGRAFSRVCDASFGDARCGLDPGAFSDGTTCARTFKACQAFGNTANYRGFPYLLGDDALTVGPQEGEIFDGGSRYDNTL